MIRFEHRVWDFEKSRITGCGLTDQIVATFHGEENRILAYHTCPPLHVVWEVKEHDQHD